MLARSLYRGRYSLRGALLLRPVRGHVEIRFIQSVVAIEPLFLSCSLFIESGMHVNVQESTGGSILPSVYTDPSFV